MRKTLINIGALLLASATLLFAGQLLGWMPAELLSVAGQSAFRTIASVAVGGCLLIAIGCWEH